MSFEPAYIVTAFILAFGLASLGSGLFTAYFGAGKSRTIGFGLTVLGLIFVFLYYYLPWMADTYEPALVKDAFMAVIGAMIGAGIAMAIILMVLMKVDTTEDLEDLDLDDLEDLDLDEELKKLEAELAAEEAQDASTDPEPSEVEGTAEPEPSEESPAEPAEAPVEEEKAEETAEQVPEEPEKKEEDQ